MQEKKCARLEPQINVKQHLKIFFISAQYTYTYTHTHAPNYTGSIQRVPIKRTKKRDIGPSLFYFKPHQSTKSTIDIDVSSIQCLIHFKNLLKKGFENLL